MIKKISKLSFVNILAQIISIVGFSVNSQLYGAEIIGGLFVVLSYSSIMSIVSSGYLEQAFFVEKNEDFFKYLLLLIFYLSVAISILTGFVLFFIGVGYVFFIMSNIFSGCLLKTITSYNISKNRIMFISMAKLIFAPIIPLLYFFSYKIYGANESYVIAISAISNLIFSILITFISLKAFQVKLNLRDFLRLRLFKLLFKRYIKFTTYSMTGEFMRTLAFRAPTIVLEKYFGKEIAGFYGVANRILLMPIMVFVGTISQIYIQKISSFKKNNQRMFKFTKKIILILTVLTILGMFLYFALGKQVLILLLGKEFIPVYSVIIALLPYAVSIVIYNPIFSVYSVFEKQEYLFKMKFFILVFSFVTFSFSVIYKDFMLGLGLFSISLFVVYSLYGLKSINIIRRYDKEIN
ncbi:lipopolysaccharide biosynthesis protein [Tenacibaculum sp. 190524A05c]|uniref:lipopolysaccharide biosynthesis protein n=1 Tax=Tenacibaculum platacis TaxID=3137852 RepID=UPI0031FA4DC3